MELGTQIAFIMVNLFKHKMLCLNRNYIFFKYFVFVFNLE